jgi:membrane fusion protein (multidrug efflux system)
MNRLVRPILLFAVPLFAVGGALVWWLYGGRYVSTENAYVKADIVQVSAEVAGRLVQVVAKDHSKVKAGDVLFKIDPEPYEIALARAEAELGSAITRLNTLKAQYREAQAESKEALSRVDFFEAQVARQRQLTTKGVGFAFRHEEAESNLQAARERVSVAEQKMARALSELSGDPDLKPESSNMVRQTKATRDRAALELERTVVRAPVDGTTVNVKMLPGEQVRTATPLFAIVRDSTPWVEANFKETELTWVRPGQTASIVLDIYPDVTWDAVVESISPATGAEFALLPPQNASGNWVKVVQRLPVRLRLKSRQDDLPLRAGMTATVKVDTKRERTLASLFGGGSIAAPAKLMQPAAETSATTPPATSSTR